MMLNHRQNKINTKVHLITVWLHYFQHMLFDLKYWCYLYKLGIS